MLWLTCVRISNDLFLFTQLDRYHRIAWQGFIEFGRMIYVERVKSNSRFSTFDLPRTPAMKDKIRLLSVRDRQGLVRKRSRAKSACSVYKQRQSVRSARSREQYLRSVLNQVEEVKYFAVSLVRRFYSWGCRTFCQRMFDEDHKVDRLLSLHEHKLCLSNNDNHWQRMYFTIHRRIRWR